jgi:iron(III) transport system permease protein
MKRIALLFLALFFGCFLIYPLIGLLGGAFFLIDAQGNKTFTLSFFRLLIENRLYRLSLVNSFEIAFLSTGFTALVSIPLAVLFTRYRFPGRELLRPALLAPLILPPFVGALGIKHIFARFGALNLLLAKVGVIVGSFAERWFFTILPTEISTQYYADVFTNATNARFVTNSLLYSGLSAFLDLGLGLVIAHLLAREIFPGKSFLDALAMLPLALPGLVLAFALLMSFNLHGCWSWINPRTNPTFLLVISYSLRRLPYIVRAAYAGYQQTSISLEEASYNLGAGRWRTFRRITLPLIAPSLIAGTILTFCFAMLEVSDSLILAMEARFAPITRGIYEIMGRPSPDSAALACALGVLAMGLLGGGLLLGSRLMGQRLGGFFRA